MIIALDLPANGFAKNSHYLKIRDRQSYAFALVSVAAVIELEDRAVKEDRVVKNVRLALGGVAHKPWLVPEAQSLLVGQPFRTETLARIADAAVSGARPLKYNAFKVELARRAVVRALSVAAGVMEA